MIINEIYSCGCGNTDQFARDAFKLLFPYEPVPPIVHPPHDYNFASPSLQKVANAFTKSDKPFAIYCMMSEDGEGAIWDLLKGKRLA